MSLALYLLNPFFFYMNTMNSTTNMVDKKKINDESMNAPPLKLPKKYANTLKTVMYCTYITIS